MLNIILITLLILGNIFGLTSLVYIIVDVTPWGKSELIDNLKHRLSTIR